MCGTCREGRRESLSALPGWRERNLGLCEDHDEQRVREGEREVGDVHVHVHGQGRRVMKEARTRLMYHSVTGKGLDRV
jgi:hypothetical protein